MTQQSRLALPQSMVELLLFPIDLHSGLMLICFVLAPMLVMVRQTLLAPFKIMSHGFDISFSPFNSVV
jgi:hypothetical protein